MDKGGVYMTRILVNALQFSPDGAGISKYSYKIAYGR